MLTLKKLQARIKYSRLYYGKDLGVERLYFRYGKNGNGIKTSAWFEVVNDKIKAFCKVENIRHKDYFDKELAQQYVSEIEQKFREILNDCELERKKTPLHERLRDDVTPVYDGSSMRHQVDALRFCCSMKVTALFADTGTGKSKIAIDLAISRYEAGQIRKVLVFLPVSTKKNFEKQLNLWCNGSDFEKLEWKLVGLESISGSNNAFLDALKFCDNETQIIVDESHMIKNPKAKRSQRLKMISAKTSYKLVMTGTPVTNNVHDVYMQYAVLSDLIIGVSDWMAFEDRYIILGGDMKDEIIGYKNIDHLMGLLEPYTYQIDKEDCLTLPTKEFKTHSCSLSAEQAEYYQLEKEKLLEIIKGDNFTSTDIFQAFIRMQQICSGYYKVGKSAIYLDSNKLNLLSEVDMSEKVIFFCKYIFEVYILVDFLGSDKCAIFTGQNKKDRDSELSDFCTNKKQYFVATMQSGGTGLNDLQEVCRRIVFYSNSFSYFHRKQSIGRIDRKGQLNEMVIHDFRTVANIDDKIMKNLSRKGNLADEIKQMMTDRTKLKKYIQGL